MNEPTAVTNWGDYGPIDVYDERKRLANLDQSHSYYVEERPGEVYPMRQYRVVKLPRVDQ